MTSRISKLTRTSWRPWITRLPFGSTCVITAARFIRISSSRFDLAAAGVQAAAVQLDELGRVDRRAVEIVRAAPRPRVLQAEKVRDAELVVGLRERVVSFDQLALSDMRPGRSARRRRDARAGRGRSPWHPSATASWRRRSAGARGRASAARPADSRAPGPGSRSATGPAGGRRAPAAPRRLQPASHGSSRQQPRGQRMRPSRPHGLDTTIRPRPRRGPTTIARRSSPLPAFCTRTDSPCRPCSRATPAPTISRPPRLNAHAGRLAAPHQPAAPRRRRRAPAGRPASGARRLRPTRSSGRRSVVRQRTAAQRCWTEVSPVRRSSRRVRSAGPAPATSTSSSTRPGGRQRAGLARWQRWHGAARGSGRYRARSAARPTPRASASPPGWAAVLAGTSTSTVSLSSRPRATRSPRTRSATSRGGERLARRQGHLGARQRPTS